MLDNFFEKNSDALQVWLEGAPASLRSIKEDRFDDMEKEMLPNFEPSSISQQAFYALGCYFSSGSPSSIAELEYSHGKYEIYLCTALQTSGMLVDSIADNMVFVLSEDDDSSNIMWSSYKQNSMSVVVGDANHDNVPDIRIDNFSAGLTYVWDYGWEIIQITNDKKLVNVLYGLSDQTVNFKSGESGFMDLDHDGVYELVSITNLQFATYDYHAYKAIYLLTDDFYYVQPDGVFDFLCIEAVENLPDSLIQYEIEDLFNFNTLIEESINNPDKADAYKEIAVVLINCDVMGIQKKNVDVFVSALNQKFPGSCRGFLYGLPEVSSYTEENGTQSKRDMNYWQDIFDQSGTCQ